MKFILTLSMCWAATFWACGQSQSPTMINLDDYQWDNRLVLIFAPSEEEEIYQSLTQSIQRDEAELVDRDIVVFHFLESGKSFVEEQTIAAESEQKIRDQYNISSGKTTIILIGKDGGEKDRQTGTTIDLASLYPLIDRMPMRRREMREKGQDTSNP